MVIRRSELQQETERLTRLAMDNLKSQTAEIAEELAAINNTVADLVNARAAAVRMQAGKPYGVMAFEIDGVAVKQEIGKKVTWDQAELAKVQSRIASSGDDPKEYIKTTLAVDERKFTAWPATIQRLFMAARDVKPSAPVLKELEVRNGGI
jgi:hypothetical protein